jgi:hypothetical protein
MARQRSSRRAALANSAINSPLLAGFSARESRLALYMMVLDDRYAARRWRPYEK